MKRPLLVVLVAVIMSTLVGAAPVHAGDRPHKLRVASYNIHAGSGFDEKFDIDRTARAISKLDASVVALQEVDVNWDERSQWRDLTEELAQRLGMHVFFGPIYRLDPSEPGQPPREYGNALLSRFPIKQAHNHEITRLSSQVPDPQPHLMPGFPEIEIKVAGKPVHIYSTHLDVQPEPDVRSKQVADMRRIMNKDRGEARILLGDFNAKPEAPELHPLWRELTDAWTAAGDDEGLTFPANEPDRRIDYIGFSRGMNVKHVDVPSTLASDHRPVVAELKLRR